MPGEREAARGSPSVFETAVEITFAFAFDGVRASQQVASSAS